MEAKTNKRTILSIWNRGSKGKTATLREFGILLLRTYPIHTPIIPVSIPLDRDFRLVVEINGIIIGVESQGDPNTGLRERLLDLCDNYNCDIIVCASRTRGETVHAVDNLFHTRDFQTIWTSTYQIANEEQHELVNRLKSEHILELLQSLNLIM